jgi:hypothetical protein
LGRKANYSIQTADPSGEFKTVAYEKKNKSTLGAIADVVGTVAPLALGFVPGFGQLSLLAKIGAAAGAGGLGAALKGDDILKGALLGGATAGIASGTGLDKAIGGALGNIAGKTAEEVAKQATGDIVVTGLSKALQSAGGALGQAALSEAGNAASRALSGYKTPAEQFAQQPLPEGLLPPADIYAGIDPINVVANRATSGSGLPFGSAFPVPIEAILSGALTAAQPLPQQQPAPEEVVTEEQYADEPIVVSAYRPINPVGGFDPTSVSKDLAGVGGSVLAALPALGNLPMDPALTARPEPQAVTKDIGLLGTALSGLPALTNLTADPALTQPTPKSDGILGTGLNLAQLLSIGGIGADLLKSLLAGGGGTGTATPYVSPFGTGAGFAPRQDMRANPNIADYERYGFGPEAMFFQPQYTGLLPGNALPANTLPPPQAEPAMTINPALMPIF